MESQLARKFQREVPWAIKQVPFQPGDDRPVYNSNWYRSQGSSERRKKDLFMKTKTQNQIFVKQVQDDLLALSDADLLRMIQQWIDGEPAEPHGDVAEDTRSALGYTLLSIDHLSCSLSTLPQSGSVGGKQWLAPTPSQLRVLLTEMDGKLFLQHVLLLAFQSLHPRYPEWGEEVTFNAHLANHLRWVGKKGRATMKGQGTAWLIKPRL